MVQVLCLLNKRPSPGALQSAKHELVNYLLASFRWFASEKSLINLNKQNKKNKKRCCLFAEFQPWCINISDTKRKSVSLTGGVLHAGICEDEE